MRCVFFWINGQYECHKRYMKGETYWYLYIISIISVIYDAAWFFWCILVLWCLVGGKFGIMARWYKPHQWWSRWVGLILLGRSAYRKGQGKSSTAGRGYVSFLEIMVPTYDDEEWFLISSISLQKGCCRQENLSHYCMSSTGSFRNH